MDRKIKTFEKHLPATAENIRRLPRGYVGILLNSEGIPLRVFEWEYHGDRQIENMTEKFAHRCYYGTFVFEGAEPEDILAKGLLDVDEGEEMFLFFRPGQTFPSIPKARYF